MPLPFYVGIDNTNDKITDTTKITTGFFDGGVGVLAGSNLTTSSLSDTQKKYYYNLKYNLKDHLSVSYGHIAGSGSSVTSGSTDLKSYYKGETEAVYKQFSSQLLSPDAIDGGFIINSITSSHCYFIVAERLQMKDRINRKNWTLHLSGATDGTAPGKEASLHLTDNSSTVTLGSTNKSPVGIRYSIVSGSAGNEITATSTNPTEWGWFYPNVGTWVIDADLISGSVGPIGIAGQPEWADPSQHAHSYALNGQSVVASLTGSGLGANLNIHSGTMAPDNPFKMVRALQLGTDTSLRAEEDQISVSYFCRAKAGQFNFSNNPTYTSGSDNRMKQSSFEGNPQVFVSTIGLYNGGSELVAVGKFSSPIQKNWKTELVSKVQLTF